MTDLAVRILSAPLGRTHIFYAGQAGYVFKSSKGTLLGIDLYLTDCVERVEGNIGFKRLLPRIMNPGEIVFDYLIATHPHFDHFDMDAIPIMMSNHHTKLLASVNCEKEVKRLMMTNENVTYVKEGDIKNADDIIVECVYCDHGEGAPDAFGVALTIDNKKIYIAGDTCLHLDKTAYFNEKGPYDLMIAPINGAYGNLNESECVELSKALKPKLTIPCHFGMFAAHGGNPETVPLVDVANDMGVKTIVTSARHTDAAKKNAWKAYDVDGMDVPGLIALANEEKVDGVLVGVADILVPSYCKVCTALNLPCYATQDIVDVFAFKDSFKATCERYGIHGIPEYYLDADMKEEDIKKIKYPVMVKPVDNGGGVGMTVVYDESGLAEAVETALSASKQKRFIVEKYMQCEDMGMYYTFKDGVCSASCIYDRYTTDEQPGMSRVCLGGTYPSKHLDEYFSRMHKNAVRMFKDIGIKNGVLMLSAFYEDGEFYVYDTGFRLQGEAPHLLMKAIHGFDQREMLINYALTGSEGDVDLEKEDDTYLRGKWAATLWFLLKKGRITKIEGIEEANNDPCVVANIMRFNINDEVKAEFIGNEKQVFTRMYLVCDTKEELGAVLKKYMNTVKVYDEYGNNMLLNGFDVNKALEL